MIAVDVGNSRMKWGLFVDSKLTESASLPLGDSTAYDEQLHRWQLHGSLSRNEPSPGTQYPELSNQYSVPATSAVPPASRDLLRNVDWAVATVNPDGSEPLLAWIHDRGFSRPIELDDPAMLPLRVELSRAESVGIDRLLNAVAINARRPAGRPAVVVDAGSAITVDAVTPDGAFIGGAIAIGLGVSARALHEFTYWLPLVQVSAAPAPVGKSTPEAMQSGLFWGTVGAIKELVRRVAARLDGDPLVYLTGGDGELLAPHLDRPVELAPELTLHGIHFAYQYVRSRRKA